MWANVWCFICFLNKQLNSAGIGELLGKVPTFDFLERRIRNFSYCSMPKMRLGIALVWRRILAWRGMRGHSWKECTRYTHFPLYRSNGYEKREVKTLGPYRSCHHRILFFLSLFLLSSSIHLTTLEQIIIHIPVQLTLLHVKRKVCVCVWEKVGEIKRLCWMSIVQLSSSIAFLCRSLWLHHLKLRDPSLLAVLRSIHNSLPAHRWWRSNTGESGETLRVWPAQETHQGQGHSRATMLGNLGLLISM